MQPFEFYTPTRILFGPDHGPAFGAAVAALGKRALVVIGGGSVKRLGYLATVADALKAAGLAVEVFEGIEPNPHSATVNKAAEVGRKFGADVVVPVGGGSAMDAAKGIAGLLHTGEPDIWPFVLGQPRAGQLAGAVPLAAVPTTAATASEVTMYSVLSKPDANEKSVLAHEFLKPKAAWVNPAFTVEVGATTTADGAADILSHVFENYLLGGNDSPIADGFTETIMRTVVDALPKVLQAPRDQALRGRLLWASTLALSGVQQAGRNPAEFVLHSMEHALSGFRPELAHGRGLATLYPSYFRWLLAHGRATDRLAQFGRRVFQLHEPDTAAAANKAVERFEGWLRETNLYQSLESLGFDPKQYDAIARYCVKVYGTDGVLNALGPVTVADIVAIFDGTKRQK